MKHYIATFSAAITGRTRLGLRIVLLVIALALFGASPAYTEQAGAPTAQQIIEQSVAAYESCNSYLDSGRVQILFITSQGRRTVVRPFTTAFVRPSAFRFEFQDRLGEYEWTQYIVWRQDAAIKSWYSITPGVRDFDNLSLAIAGATGVSGGSANRIPSLLMPDLFRGSVIKSLTGLKLAGEEQVEGKAVYKIEGQNHRGGAVTLWIDKQRMLILQVFEKATIPGMGRTADFETETTTFYDPQINEDVPAAKLAFNPPAR
jgi:hypothetical protein